MDDQQRILRHVLATLAYRTWKALDGLPDEFAEFEAGHGAWTPLAIVTHMVGLLLRIHGWYGNEVPGPPENPEWHGEIARLHVALVVVDNDLQAGLPPTDAVTWQRMVQGPLLDAVTHAGQLALLRRLYGVPMPRTGYMNADIAAGALGPEVVGEDA